VFAFNQAQPTLPSLKREVAKFTFSGKIIKKISCVQREAYQFYFFVKSCGPSWREKSDGAGNFGTDIGRICAGNFRGREVYRKICAEATFAKTPFYKVSNLSLNAY
jgi:hypothetical protein